MQQLRNRDLKGRDGQQKKIVAKSANKAW